MQCPLCSVELTMSERQGIEIDYCPRCRGVWLDRGELDKIIEKSSQPSPAVKPEETRHEQYRHHDEHQKHHHGYKKKKSFLEELFD